MPRRRLKLHRYPVAGDEVELGVASVPAMRTLTAAAVDATSIRLDDEPPVSGVPLEKVRRTCTKAVTGAATTTFDDSIGTRTRIFTGLTADSTYNLTTAAIDTDGRIGPAISATAKTQVATVVEPTPEPEPEPTSPTSGTVILDETFSDSWTLTASKNDTSEGHPWIRCEPGDPTMYVSGGTFKINASGGVYARQISDFRFGGPGKKIRITCLARVTKVDSNDTVSGTIPGLKLGMKYSCPTSKFAEDDWRSVQGYDQGDSSPGSFIFLTGIGAKGRLQLPRNQACGGSYESTFYTKDIGYTLGSWVGRTILHEHVGTSSSDSTWRVRYWNNDTQSGSPMFDHVVTHPTIQVKAAYLWLRTDFCTGEYSYIKVEDVT